MEKNTLTQAKKPMKSMTYILFTALSAGLFVTPAGGQGMEWYFESSVFQNDHYLGSSIPDDQQSLGIQTGIATFPTDQVRLTLDLSGQQVYTNTDYSQYNLWTALDWRSIATDYSTRWRSFSGIGLGMHQYADEFSYNNYYNLQTYFRTKYDVSKVSFFELRYFLELKAFTELPEASNWQHWFDLKVHQSFPTNTAVTVHLGGGVQDFISLSSLNPIQSNGRRSERVSLSTGDLPTNTLGYIGFRASQSISARLGIYYDYKYQKRLDDNAVGAVLVLEDETSPIIDDFFWAGVQQTVGANIHLPKLTKLSVTGGFSDQDYMNVPVYAFDFETGDFQTDVNGDKIMIENARNSQATFFQTTLTKTIQPGRNQDLGSLDIWLQGRYEILDGNDPLYQYSGQQWVTGVTFNF